ncbi:MAG: hypothetical protein V2B20_04735 [Pseudomonadota bacterium]
MQSANMYFFNTIEQCNLFRQAATSIIEGIHTLTPDDIYQRCEKLSTILKEITENKEQFFTVLEFFGPGVLDTSSIGEFQRALDKSILACDSLYAEILIYKRNLAFQPA